MMLNQLHEQIVGEDGEPVALVPGAAAGPSRSTSRRAGLSSFGSSWVCRSGGSRPRVVTLEKRLLIPHLQNTIHVSYRLVEGTNVPTVRASSASAGAFPLT